MARRTNNHCQELAAFQPPDHRLTSIVNLSPCRNTRRRRGDAPHPTNPPDHTKAPRATTPDSPTPLTVTGPRVSAAQLRVFDFERRDRRGGEHEGRRKKKGNKDRPGRLGCLSLALRGAQGTVSGCEERRKEKKKKEKINTKTCVSRTVQTGADDATRLGWVAARRGALADPRGGRKRPDGSNSRRGGWEFPPSCRTGVG